MSAQRGWFDEVVHHLVLDGSAEMAVVLSGDARIEAAEVAGVGVKQRAQLTVHSPLSLEYANVGSKHNIDP